MSLDPSMLVNSDHRAVHLSESAGRYLQPSGGSVTADAADMVRPELRFELRAALHRAFEVGEASLSLPLPVQFNGSPHRMYLMVRPLVQDGDLARYALVFFIEGEAVEQPTQEAPLNQREPASQVVQQLRDDLQLAQTRLRVTREEAEATNEELRAANEELQSINEEYRSTSEELETSKEELQSINEELQTVNSELKVRLESVSRAHSDLQNLMAAADFGTLFLDTSLRIKRFTPKLTDLFNITLSDEGRPITDFTHQLEYDLLADHARSVLRDLTPIEHEVKGKRGGWYRVRLRPYRTIDDKIDGVVVTFIDISERLQAETALRDSEDRLRQEMHLVDLSRSPIFVWDFDEGILQWNRGSEELYGYSRDEIMGRRKEEVLLTQVPGSSFEELKQSLQANGTWSGELLHRTKDGRVLTVESHIELVSFGGRRLVLESTRDITEQKRWEERRQLLVRELVHRVGNSLAVVQSIASQMLRSMQSPADFVKVFEGRLSALAVAHQLLIDTQWEGIDLDRIARGQLAAYIDDDQRFTIEGPPVRLSSELGTPFGLVLHELATNAAKYGALSAEGGRVALNWTRNGNLLRVCWVETGGPSVQPPQKQGFGGTLIERGLPGATVRRQFCPAGVTCTMDVTLPEDLNDGSDKRSPPTPTHE